MSFLSTKNINGKKRRYLEHSVRIYGKVKKFSLYLRDYQPGDPLNKYERLLDEKVEKEIVETAVQRYTHNHIFTKEKILRLELMKRAYLRLSKNISEKQWQDIIHRFAINFTYESNALEGNSLTLKDVTFALEEGWLPRKGDVRELFETINAKKALNWIFQKRPRLEKETILRLHKILVENTGISTGYKKFHNMLLGRQVKTTPPEKVEKEMEELLDWYKGKEETHPLQLAAEFHARFERIHPFEDGNGRTGRLITNIMLMNDGYPPIIIRKTQKRSYFGALEAFDKGHKDRLFRFFIERYEKTYEEFFEVYVRYVK